MRSFVLAALLLTPMTALAADKPNPADFTITVHVVSSGSSYYVSNGNSIPIQVLEITIEGQPMQLEANGPGLLPLGDYKARVAPRYPTPRNRAAFDIYKGYDLLMSDGSSRTYGVTRLGPAVLNR